MKKVFKITGMNCEHCVKRVETGISELTGIDKVKVNLKKGEAKVTFDATILSADTIAKKVSEVGFNVTE